MFNFKGTKKLQGESPRPGERSGRRYSSPLMHPGASDDANAQIQHLNGDLKLRNGNIHEINYFN